MGICRASLRVWGFLAFALVATSALAEHEYPAEPVAAEEPSLRKTASDGLIQPAIFAKPVQPTSGLNSLAILKIQETVSRTDPQMLQALKQALEDIAEGRKVDGQAGAIALELLNKIPDSELGASAPKAAAPPPPVGKLAESAGPSPDRFKEFAAEGPKAEPAPTRLAPGTAAANAAGATVRLEIPSAASPSGATRTIASVSNPSFGEVFPYGTSSEATGKEEEPSGAGRADRGLGKRPSKAPAQPGSGGESLPTGQGQLASGGSGGFYGGGAGGGYQGTILMNSGTGTSAAKSAAPDVAQGKQRLAGVVSSFLGRFQGRAIASAADGESRPGIFGKIALQSGVTTERALAKAASSPVFREFQKATTEAGFSPSESLGAYYSVLALAWLVTFGFVAYLMRNLPALRLAWAERRKKKS